MTRQLKLIDTSAPSGHDAASRIGLDSVRIHLGDFDIRRDNQFNIKRSDIPASGEQPEEHLLFSDSRGYEMRGYSAYINQPHFNADLGAGNQLSVKISVPKFSRGDNFFPATQAETTEVFKRLQSTLDDAGIRTNLDRAELSRVDIFRQFQADEHFDSYGRVYRVLDGKRQQKRDYGTTYLWHNTQRELTIYDKIAEMTARKQPTGNLPDNIQRAEFRMMRKRVIEKHLGFKTLAFLKTDYGEIEPAYRGAFSGLLKYDEESFEIISSSQIERELKFYQQQSERGFVDRWAKAAGYRTAFMSIGESAFRDLLLRLLGSDDASRRQVRRKIAEVRKAASEYEILQGAEKMKTNIDLYAEMKSKLLAA